MKIENNDLDNIIKESDESVESKDNLEENNIDENKIENTEEKTESEETELEEIELEEIESEETESEETESEEEIESIVETYIDYDYKARKTFQMYFINVKSHMKIMNIIMLVACLALTIYSFIISNYFIAIAGILVLAYLLYSILTQEKKVDKAIIKIIKSNPMVRFNYALNEEYILLSQTVEGKEYKNKVSWAYVQEVHCIDEYYFLFLQGTTWIIDRNPANITKGDKDSLDNLMAKVCQFKPFKYYNKPLNIKYNYKEESND